jgi:MFS family permease
MSNHREPWNIVRILAFTQVVSWGSLYYAFTILAPGMLRETGWSTGIVFGAYSWSLLIAGLASTPAGMLLDRFGGRYVMGLGSLLAGVGLLWLGNAQSVAHYFAAWTVIGVAMAMVLYEAAFATINREFLLHARKGISVLTLFGGLASTVFWPLTLKLNGMFGWRTTWMIYGAVQLAMCAPLHALLAAGERRSLASGARAASDTLAARDFTLQEALRDPTFWKLAFAFSANMFIFSALAVHLIPLLQRFGHSIGTAVFVATLIGPFQVVGRIGEMTFARNALPQTVGKLVFATLPVALLALLLFGEHQIAAAGFCVLFGLSNGILTIVRGTVPQALFGRENYGAISGAMAGPALLAKAAGPLAVAAFVEVNSSPYWLLAILLLVSAVSLGFYLAALQATRPEAALAMGAD